MQLARSGCSPKRMTTGRRLLVLCQVRKREDQPVAGVTTVLVKITIMLNLSVKGATILFAVLPLLKLV